MLPCKRRSITMGQMFEEPEFFSLEEIEKIPLLKNLQWSRRRLATAIQMGFIEGRFDPNTKEHVLTKQMLKDALDTRNYAMRKRDVDPDLLDKA